MIFPEIAAQRHDLGRGPWSVGAGSNVRGGASCDLAARHLTVPLDGSTRSRVVRAHELVHARVSPLWRDIPGELRTVPPRLLECAEEFRVNTIVARLGLGVESLADGSERSGGRWLAETAQWDEAVCFLLAVLGTGGEKPYLLGLRAVEPTWAPALRALAKRATSMLAEIDLAELTSLEVDDRGIPKGYATATLRVAEWMTTFLDAAPPRSSEEVSRFRRSVEPGGRRPRTGIFAELVVAPTLLREASSYHSIRRHRPATTGRSLRYPSRLVTDPDRRIFSAPARSAGGIVIIDQSGSMDIDVTELTRAVRAHRDALIVGYSHRPGDRTGSVNCWLLASRGRVTETIRPGNVGNGVDGPVLRWALAQRRNDEPLVWVTDGQVTDSNDHPDEALTRECAELVRRGRIRLVRTVAEAGGALRHAPHRAPEEFGRVGRFLKMPK